MTLNISKATLDDLMDVFIWRNDDCTREMSLSTSLIDLDDHRVWYSNVLNSNQTSLFIIKIDQVKIAVCRFDTYIEGVEVSINLNPEYRGQGLASEVLKLAMDNFQKGGSCRFLARIKKINIKSISLFNKAGFVFLLAEDGYDLYVKE